jgi:lysophospholipase L1-like esterase
MKLSFKATASAIIALLIANQIAIADGGPIDVASHKKPIIVACVGDSITAGVGTEKGRSYPAQLQAMLGADWKVNNFGNSGSTLLNHGDKPYQKQGSFKQALASNPDVVVIKLGTNDTKPQNWKFKDEFITDYMNLIGQFTALPSKPRIFICRPAPVPGKGNFGINEAGVQEEIPLLDKIAAEEKATVIDIHASLADHPEFLPDRVHPNTKGATLMAKAVFKSLTGKEFSGEPVFQSGK